MVIRNNFLMYLWGLLLFTIVADAQANVAAQSQAGLLDSSFSTDGVMSQSVYYDKRNITEHANAIISDSNQRLLVIGSNNREYNGYWGSAFISRFTSNGSLDSTFADNGTLQLAYGHMLSDIKLDSVGRIVISGYEFKLSNDDCWETQTLLIRLNADGQYDDSFGDAGIIKTDKTECELDLANTAAGLTVVIDSQDNIITNSLLNVDEGFQHLLIKYSSAGVLDSAFGSNGVVNTGLIQNSWESSNVRLALDDKDNILMASNENGDFDQQGKLKVFKYQTDGRLDISFADNGIAMSQTLDYRINLDAILVAKDGSILLVEHEGYAKEQVYVYSLSADGQLNSQYGSNGSARVDIPDSLGVDLGVEQISAGLDSNDNLLVTFYGEHYAIEINKMAVLRLDSTGQIDGQFGTDGSTIIDKEGFSSGARRVHVDVLDQVYVSGYITNDIDSDTDLLMAKIKTDGTVSQDFATEGLSIASVAKDLQAASYDVAKSMVFLNNGDLLHIGSMSRSVDSVADKKLLITMMNDQGQLNSDYGDGGQSLLSLTHTPDTVKALMDPLQRIVVVVAGEKSLTMLRLLDDGSLDSTFGEQGYFVTNYDHEILVKLIHLLPNGQDYKIVAAIEQYLSLDTNKSIAAQLLAVTSAGQLDTAFAQGTGQLTLASYEIFGLFNSSDDVLRVMGSDYALITTEHFNLSGEKDTSYSSTGIVAVSPHQHSALQDQKTWQLRAAAQDINGNIWAIINYRGIWLQGTNKLLKFNRAGEMDLRFVKDISQTDLEIVSENVERLTVDLNGQLLVTQHRSRRVSDWYEFYGSNVIRLSKEGDIDNGFGLSGKSITLDTQSFDTAIDNQGRLYLAGIRPDGDSMANSGNYTGLSNYSVVRMGNLSPGLNAPQSLALWLNEGMIKTITSNDLQLTTASDVTLNSTVNAGQLFNDINANSQVDGDDELLSQGSTISKSDMDAGQLKFIGQGSQSAYFQFTVGTASQVALLQVNPKPVAQLYTPVQSALTEVMPIVEVDFGEWVSGFDVADVTVTNGTADSITFDGYRYLVKIAPSSSLADGDLITVGVAADAVTDLSGAGSDGANASFAWISLLPVEISAPSMTQTGIQPVSFDITFTDVVNFELTLDEVQLISEGEISAQLSIENGNTLTPKVTVNGITGNGSFYILISQGAGQSSTAKQTQARQSQRVQVVNVKPIVSVTLDTQSQTVHGPSSYSLSFVHAVSVNLTADMVEVVSDDGVTAQVDVIDGTSLTPQIVLRDFRGVGLVGITLPAGIALSESGLPSSALSYGYSIRLLENHSPSIGGNAITTINQGEAYEFQPTANDIDGNEGLLFAIANKPSWLDFDQQTGALSGTPGASNVGVFQDIIVSVTDPRGDSASAPGFNIEVLANDDGTDGGTDGGGDGTDGTDGTVDGEDNAVTYYVIFKLLLEDKEKQKPQSSKTVEPDSH